MTLFRRKFTETVKPYNWIYVSNRNGGGGIDRVSFQKCYFLGTWYSCSQIFLATTPFANLDTGKTGLK